MTARARTRRSAGVPVYRGRFGREQAERLLWRAGFGPRPGEARHLSSLGLEGAVRSLAHPGPEKLVGRRPHVEKGRPLAPGDRYGHDQLWWLDKMVRTSRPLVERMTLVWHDWFATSNDGVGSQTLMVRQNRLFRRLALDPFRELLVSVTANPAMLLWLNGAENTKDAPNENYARELMELFTLGASQGYTEQDVRQQARALTGFTYRWTRNRGPAFFRYDTRRHDTGAKRIFGHVGRFDWRDACRLCLQNPAHPPFFVRKLWSYFMPTEIDPETQAALERLYVSSRYGTRPVIEAILRHPDLYTGPRMVKSPAVYLAGLMRARGRGIDGTEWTWLMDLAGQSLFHPPNVSGWDDTRWLDTSRWRGRWFLAAAVAEKWSERESPPRRKGKKQPPPRKFPTAEALVSNAVAFWGYPTLQADTRAALTAFARTALDAADEDWKRQQYPPMASNALRQLIAVSPDLQTA